MEKACLFEVSWEVCNKVGGIYTVITSKAPHLNKKDRCYTFIGPYLHHKADIEFVEEIVPDQLKEVFEDMKREGLPCRFGKWLIKSEPRVVLIDFGGLYAKKDEIRKMLWETYQVDSLGAPFDFDEPVVFSVAAAKFIDKYQKKTNANITAQFHEWMTGAGILWLKKENPKVATVFTTHATVLGRAMVSSTPNFYGVLPTIKPENEAKSHGVVSKHHVEKESAKASDVFTTVSAITGLEAEHLLGRKPDVLLPNGLDLENFPSFEETSIKHKELKHSIKDLIISFFFPHYSFEIDNTLIYFIFGRYEFENKGIDIFIESLGRLNAELKKQESSKTVIAFFYIPAAVNGVNHDVLQSKTIFNDLKHYIDTSNPEIKDKIITSIVSQNKLTKESVFSEDFLSAVKKKSLSFVKEGNPPYSTHDLKFYDNDAMINGFKRAQLNNHESDKVKVILYPAYLKPTDNLLGLDVYEAILGGHLGVFPSAYEPWGYTPLEAAALGVAAITSDLSGFGIYIEPDVKPENPGIFINKRFGKTHEESVADLFNILNYYTSLDKEGRIENKIEARRIATLADWKKLVKFYDEAHAKAAKKFGKQ